MKKYVVKTGHDIEEGEDECSVEVIAYVLEIIEGSDVKVKDGSVVFRSKGKSDKTQPLIDGVARFEFGAARESKVRQIKIEAEYTNRDGITASGTTLINIPAKEKSQKKESDSSRPKFIVVLERPAHPEFLEDDGVKYNFVIRLRGSQSDLHGKSLRLFLDDTPHTSKPVTDKAGEAFVPVEFEQRAKDRSIRVTARLEVGGQTFVSNPQMIIIPKKEEWLPYWKPIEEKLWLDAKVEPLGDNRHKIALKGTLKKIDVCTRGEEKGRTREIELPDNRVEFEFDGERMDNALVTSHTTDSYGEVPAEIVYNAATHDRKVYCSAFTTIEFERKGISTAKIIRSKTSEVTIPKKIVKKPKLVKKIIAKLIYRNGDLNIFRITLLSDEQDTASLTDDVVMCAGIDADARIPGGEFKPLAEFEAQTNDGYAVVELKLRKPGILGSVTFTAKNAPALTSEPQRVISEMPQLQTN